MEKGKAAKTKVKNQLAHSKYLLFLLQVAVSS